MGCTARILRERKQLGRFPGEKSTTVVKVYCPLLGEIVLSGEQAETAVANLRENKKYQTEEGD
ncbi:MAG: hypothetical protein KAT86_06490 [Candidatus Latescibacteria bacterium]|nr:hypothetical protein [Candidatus Latescibacterota bacterium]